MTPRKSFFADFVLVGAAAVLFGIYPSAAKLSYSEGANPVFLIIVTTFFRALLLVSFCVVTRKSILPQRGNRWVYCSGGFFQAVSAIGVIASLKYLPGPVTITILFTHTIMLLLYMAYRGELKLGALVVGSTVLALFGVSLVVDVWTNVHALSITGIALAVIAALATASRLYVFGHQLKSELPAVVGARVFVVAFLFTLTLLALESVNFPSSLRGYFWTGVSCFSLALGTFATFYGIARLGSFKFSLFLKLEPAFAALFSFLLLAEVLSWSQYLGMGIVIVSLLSYQLFAPATTAQKKIDLPLVIDS